MGREGTSVVPDDFLYENRFWNRSAIHDSKAIPEQNT